MDLDDDDLQAPDFADALLQEFDESTTWPLPRELHARNLVSRGRALRKGDRERLKLMHEWSQKGPADREYVIDNLAKRICFGWADFLFADEPTITAAGSDQEPKEDDGEGQDAGAGNAAQQAAQEEIDRIVETTRMPALLHRAERKVISEGEAWWKLHVNQAVADCALLSWCSRLDTVPLFYGERPVAVAFITERKIENALYWADDESPSEVVYRHAEIHAEGRVLNVLYRGLREELGTRIPLDQITQTAGYNPEWRHGLPMLAGRVVNDLDDDDTIGDGEFVEGVEDMLLALNEGVTIAVENARLTGKDRIFAAGRFMQSDGSFDASLEVFQMETDGGTLGEDGGGKMPIVAVEKKYDAQPLWLHITNLVKTIVTRVGLVPQWIGESVEGHGETGLAIRLRFIPTTNAAKGKTREWSHVIPHIIDLQLRIADLPVDQGGFARQVAQDEPPAVEFADPIPTDMSRDLIDAAAAVVSEVMSRRTAVRTVHPEWSDEQVQDELDEIDKDRETEIRNAPPPPNPDGLLPAMPPGFKPIHPPASAR